MHVFNIYSAYVSQENAWSSNGTTLSIRWIYIKLGGLSKVLVEKLASLWRSGGGVLVHDVLQLHCQLILVVIIHSCGWTELNNLYTHAHTHTISFIHTQRL